MRRLLVLALLLAFPVLTRAQTEACSESGNNDAPYACSTFLTDLSFDCGDSLVVSEGVGSDLWVMTWHSDGLVYSGWGDGEGFNGGETHLGTDASTQDSTLGIGAITGTPVWDSKDSGGAWTWDDLQDWRNCTGCIDASSSEGKINALEGVSARDTVPAMLYGIHWGQDILGKDPAKWFYWDPVSDVGTYINICSQELASAASPWTPTTMVQFNAGHAVPTTAFANSADDDYLYFLATEWLGVNGNNDAILGRTAIPTGSASDICTSAVEYVSAIDGSNVPTWDSNVNNAISIFTDTNFVSPSSSSLTYVEDLDRFVLTMNHKFNGASSSNGVNFSAIGFFEAETPWGPWSTIHYFHDSGEWCGLTPAADQGLGIHVPVKWFHNSGQRFYAATSTQKGTAQTCFNSTICDSFNLVQGELTVSGQFYVSPSGVDDASCGASLGDACKTLGQLFSQQDLGGGNTVWLEPGTYYEVDPTTGDGAVHASADGGSSGNPVTVRCNGALGDCVISGLYDPSDAQQLDTGDWTKVGGATCLYEQTLDGTISKETKNIVMAETAGTLIANGYTVCDYGTDLDGVDCAGQTEGAPCDYCEGEFGAPSGSTDGDGEDFRFTTDTGLTMWHSDLANGFGSNYGPEFSDANLDDTHGSWKFDNNSNDGASASSVIVRTYFCEDPGADGPGVQLGGKYGVTIVADHVTYQDIEFAYGFQPVILSGTRTGNTFDTIRIYGAANNTLVQSGGTATDLIIRDSEFKNQFDRSDTTSTVPGSLVDTVHTGAMVSIGGADNALLDGIIVRGGWAGISVNATDNSTFKQIIVSNILNHPFSTDDRVDDNVFEQIALFNSQDDAIRARNASRNTFRRILGAVSIIHDGVDSISNNNRLSNIIATKIPLQNSVDYIEYVAVHGDESCTTPAGSIPCASAAWATEVGATTYFDTKDWTANDVLSGISIDFSDKFFLDVFDDTVNGFTFGNLTPATGATNLINTGDPDLDADGVSEPSGDDECTVANYCDGAGPDLGAFESGIESPGDPACSDGADNDNDGLTDYQGGVSPPGDPGCSSDADTSERGSDPCDDGADNDGDGNADYPADEGCTGPSDALPVGAEERGASAGVPYECDDNVDNDGDGDTDYPADTDGCTLPEGPVDDSELAAQCGDGIDNDGDGFTDLDDIGCDDAADVTEGTMGASPWDMPCSEEAWYQTLDDMTTSGGGITVNINSATYPCTTITTDKDHAEYANEIGRAGFDSNGNTINGGGVTFEPETADQWWNRNICGAGVACDSTANGHPDLCPTSEEQDPRFLVIRTDNNTVRDLTFRWYGDGITFDDGGVAGINTEAKSNVVDNVTCEYAGDNCFRNEGDMDNDGNGSSNCGTDTADCSAQNNTVSNFTILNACDKSMQQQGRETDVALAFASVNDYDMILDTGTCTNCRQGVRVTNEGRYRVNDVTWVTDSGQIPAGTGSGLYDCDNAIRISSDGGSCDGGDADCAGLVRVTGNTSMSGCGDNVVLVENYGQVIVEGTGNAVFSGSNDAFEVRDQGRLSVEGTVIQGNSPTGIFWNTLNVASDVSCGSSTGAFVSFTQPDGNVTSTGGNTFASNATWDVRNDNPQTMDCESNTFDCPQPPNPKTSGNVDYTPQAGSCGTEPTGSVIRGVRLDGVTMP